MGVTNDHASLDETRLHGAGVCAERLPDGCERLPLLVPPDSLVDPVRVQAAPCLDAVVLEDLGDGRPVDAVLACKLTLCGAGLVPLDQIELVLGGQVDLALAFGG